MDKQLQTFRHHDIRGAVIRILDDEPLSLNEFLDADHQLEEGDEYDFAYTCCYLNYRGKHLLIDAGFDPDTTPGALESIDVSTEDIDLVLLTHADRDHVAGLLMHDGSLTYPNAQHVIGRELWENLAAPTTLGALKEERGAFFRRFVKVFDDQIRLLNDGDIVSDGIRFIANPGHRVGHAVYELESEGEPLVHSGDAFFHSVFAEHPDWPNVTDSIPDQAVESRNKLVRHLAATGAFVLSSHIPFPGIGMIRATDTDVYEWISGEVEAETDE